MLPSYILSQYFTELCPILIHRRSIFSFCIKSKQYPHAQKLSAGVKIIRRRNIYLRGRACKEKSVKIFSPKVWECRKWVIQPTPYLYTWSRTIPYLNTLNRKHPACAQNRRIVASQSESSTKNPHVSSANQNRARKNPSTSSANQNRVLRHTSRQPIRIEDYVTRELSVMVEDTFRLCALVGLL